MVLGRRRVTGDAEIDWEGRQLQSDIKGDYDPNNISVLR